MPIGRNADSKAAYLAATKKERKDMVLFSLCDADATRGLARDYNAQDMRWLSSTRQRLCPTKTDRLKRRSDFYHILSRIAARDERANVWSEL